jgi:two-component system chemotaxis sensor kinase CheA
VHIESAPGAGTTIMLRVPLTVAIVDAYHVLSGNRHLVIPADAVIECREWSPGSPHHGFTEREGSPLPCVRLSFVLGSTAAAPPREELIIVGHDDLRAGLIVDTILGSSLTVVKPLGFSFNDLPGLAGFTILGDGQVAPILDVAGVLDQCRALAETAP